MAYEDLDQNLSECRNDLPHELSSAMRIRLDDTYRVIRQMEQQPGNLTNDTIRTRPLRKAMVSVCAAAVIGTLVLSPVWISPAIADTLKQVPIVGNLFKLAGDFGIQKGEEEGLAEVVNESASQDGFSITATKVMYDGIRIAMELTRTAPDGTEGALYHLESIMNNTAKEGSFEHIQVWLPSGRYGNLTLGTDLVTDPSESVLVQLQELSGDIPDQFDMTVKVGLKGYKQPFEIKVPVVKTIDHTVITSEESMAYNGTGLNLSTKIEMSPITTRLTINTSDEYLLNDLQFDIVDEKGNLPKQLGGGSSYDDLHSVSYTYEAFPSEPESITIKPFFHHMEKKYIPELEFTILAPNERKPDNQ